MKLFFKILISLLLILLLTTIGLLTFIDPNRYKTDIVHAVQQHINQPFVINGDIRWQLWPQIALFVEDAQLGDPAHLLHIQQMNIAIHLLPLLQQRQVDIKINDFSIHWQDGSKAKFDRKIENINISVQGRSRDSNQITIDTVHIDHLEMEKIYFDLLTMLVTLTDDHIIINNLSMDHFSLGKMTFANLATTVDSNNSIITMKPFNAELFKGKVNGDMILNLQQPNPDAKINAHIQQADLSQLLNFMTPDNQITGTIDMDLKVTATGLDSSIMQQHAQGDAKIHIEQCIYHGSHLAKALTDTVTSVNNLKDAGALVVDSVTLTSAMIAQNHEGNKVAGTLAINQGIVDALDLMVNDKFPIKRYGPIDLPHQLIDLCFDFHKKP